MGSFWERLLGRREPSSAAVARERLQLVLVTDRSELSPERLEQMQHEILEVIKRYLQINEARVNIKLEQRQRMNYLVADIPLARDRPYDLEPPGPLITPTNTPEPTPDTQPRKPDSASDL